MSWGAGHFIRISFTFHASRLTPHASRFPCRGEAGLLGNTLQIRVHLCSSVVELPFLGIIRVIREIRGSNCWFQVHFSCASCISWFETPSLGSGCRDLGGASLEWRNPVRSSPANFPSKTSRAASALDRSKNRPPLAVPDGGGNSSRSSPACAHTSRNSACRSVLSSCKMCSAVMPGRYPKLPVLQWILK